MDLAQRLENIPENFQNYVVRIRNDVDLKLSALQTRVFDMYGFCSEKAAAVFLKVAAECN